MLTNIAISFRNLDNPDDARAIQVLVHIPEYLNELLNMRHLQAS